MATIHKTSSEHIVAFALDDVMVYAFFGLVHSLRATAKARFTWLVGHFRGRLSVKNQRLIRVFLEQLNVDFQLIELTPHPLFTERRHLTITKLSKFVISDQVHKPHLWLATDTIAREGWVDIFAPLLVSRE